MMEQLVKTRPSLSVRNIPRHGRRLVRGRRPEPRYVEASEKGQEGTAADERNVRPLDWWDM